MIELVVTDLDGTFWDHELRTPPRHAAAIEALAADGVPVLLATSRRKRVVEAALRPLGWLPPAVLLDGALGVDLATGQRFHEAAFSKPAAANVLAVFEQHGLRPCLYVDDPEIDVVVPPRPSTCDAHVDYLRDVSRRATPAIVVDEGTVQGFSIFGGELVLLEPLATVLRAVGAEVVLAEDDRFGGHSIVVSPPAVTKWNGVASYCETHGLDPNAVAAIGDGDNDIDMLRQARLPIAVRGGTPGVLELGAAVIAPPEEEGWASVPELVRRLG